MTETIFNYGHSPIKRHDKRPLPIGARFGRWTVVDPDAGRSKSGNRLVRCKCECGNIGLVVAAKLKNGWSSSCGCFSREKQRDVHTIHGWSKTSTYSTWIKIRDRCQNKEAAKYPDYGGRGISVCERWQKFQNFLADMGEKPGPEYSLDRIDNDGDYRPENCRWADAKTQSNNRRSNRFIEFDGERKTIAQWADETGLSQHMIFKRLERGWSIERTLTQTQASGAQS